MTEKSSFAHTLQSAACSRPTTSALSRYRGQYRRRLPDTLAAGGAVEAKDAEIAGGGADF